MSQQREPWACIFSFSMLAYTKGWWTMNGAPKQVLKVILGSVPNPISVPAIFEV